MNVLEMIKNRRSTRRYKSQPIKQGILEKGFPEKHIEVFDRVEDAISRAYAVKTDQHKYILLENDLPDNY